MARVNKALRINRAPKIAARILLEMDDAGLLGTALHVVGTNSLFAYEMRAGVLLSSDMLSTGTPISCSTPVGACASPAL
jgi:hypothetical protein